MKRLILAVCGAAAIGMTGLAQTPPTPSSPGQTGTSSDRYQADKADKDKNVTFVGCLRTGSDAQTYVLTSAQESASAAGMQSSTSATGTATGTTGTGTAATGTDPSAPAVTGAIADRYRLVGKSDELSQHLNHKVEISGSLSKSHGEHSRSMTGSAPESTSGTTPSGQSGTTGSTSGTTGAMSSGAAAAGPDADRMLPSIKVKSVRMISESCS